MEQIVYLKPPVNYMLIDSVGNYSYLHKADDYPSALNAMEEFALDAFKQGNATQAELKFVLVDWENNTSNVFVFEFEVTVTINSN